MIIDFSGTLSLVNESCAALFNNISKLADSTCRMLSSQQLCIELSQQATISLNETIDVVDGAMCLKDDQSVCMDKPILISYDVGKCGAPVSAMALVTMKMQRWPSGEVLVFDASYSKPSMGRPLKVQWSLINPDNDKRAALFFAQQSGPVVFFPLILLGKGRGKRTLQVSVANWMQKKMRSSSVTELQFAGDGGLVACTIAGPPSFKNETQ